MTITSHPIPPPSPQAQIAEAIWVGVPLALRRFSAGLAVATVDGLYFAVRPLAGAIGPPAVFLFGLFIGATHLGFDNVFTEALWLLMFVAALGALSGALGLYFTVGFVLADLVLGAHPVWRWAWQTGPEAIAGKYGSWFITYLLMALLAVGVPIAAKSLASEFTLPPSVPRLLRALVGLGALVFVTGLLVFVWVQSAPLLVRPVFVWAGARPTVDAIEALQENGGWVIGAAVVAAIVRAVLQGQATREPGAAGPDRLAELTLRFRTDEPVVPLLSRVPLLVRLIARAFLITILLSGLFAAYWQASITFAVLLAAQIVASPLVPLRLGAYGRIVVRIPRLIRVLIVVIPVYLLGTVVLNYFLARGETSFIPFLLLTVVSAVLMTLLSPSPPPSPTPSGEQAEEERR